LAGDITERSILRASRSLIEQSKAGRARTAGQRRQNKVDRENFIKCEVGPRPVFESHTNQWVTAL